MKNLRQLCTAVVLILTLAISALAGDMHTTVVEPPPPSADGQMHTGIADGHLPTTVAGQMQTTVAGQMETTIAGQMETPCSVASTIDPLTQIAVNVLHSMLSLF